MLDEAVGRYNNPPIGLYSLDLANRRLNEIVDPFENTVFVEGTGGVQGVYVGPMLHFDFSIDGSRIAFSTCRYSSDDDYEIVVSNADGTELERLTENRMFDNFPVWSPDGTRIAFISDRPVGSLERWAVMDIHSTLRLYTMAADGSDVQLVVPEIGDDSMSVLAHPPKWSPDGQRLLFVADDRGPRIGWEHYPPLRGIVYSSGVDGSNLTRIAEAVSEPAWSPDGKRIALIMAEGDEGAALYTFASDGSNPVRVAKLFSSLLEHIRVFGYHPEDSLVARPQLRWMGGLSWSPDGSMILLEESGVRVSIEESRVDYFLPLSFDLINLPGLSSYGPIRRIAAWSPDGSRIAVRALSLGSEGWISYVDGSVMLYTMSRDGADPRVLVRSVHTEDGDSRMVAWDPVRPPADPEACSAGHVVAEPESNPGLVEDCRTLLAIRDTLAGSGVLDWSSDTPITEWRGLRVEGEPPRVRGLQFLRRSDDEPNLYGQLPPEIGDLEELTGLNISYTQLNGPIPPELGNLKNLEFLSIHINRITGPIPAELGNLSSLRILRLYRNQLSDSIPPALGNLENLATLDLGYNHLSGSIPPELGSLKNLQTLRLFQSIGNQLTGCVPAALRYVENTRLGGVGYCSE